MLQARHITAGLGVGLAASYLVWLHRRRTRPRLAAEATAGDAAAEEEEVCAICLSTPELPCKTQCGHRFCTDCFVAWWQRQPGVLGGPHVGEARCPLCTRSVVRLSPEFGATVSGGLSRLRAIVLYNVGATITRRLRLARRWLDAVRLVGERTTLSVYAVTGVVWEVARNELHSSLVQVPPPADERVRFFCAWQMLATAFGHHLDLPLLQWASRRGEGKVPPGLRRDRAPTSLVDRSEGSARASAPRSAACAAWTLATAFAARPKAAPSTRFCFRRRRLRPPGLAAHPQDDGDAARLPARAARAGWGGARRRHHLPALRGGRVVSAARPRGPPAGRRNMPGSAPSASLDHGELRGRGGGGTEATHPGAPREQRGRSP